MKPEYQEAIERIDADRKRWMKTELMVDCQISGDMAETLIDEFFGKRSVEPAFWIAKDRLQRALSGDIGLPHVYTTDQSHHFECVPLFLSAQAPPPSTRLIAVDPGGCAPPVLMEADPAPRTRAISDIIGERLRQIGTEGFDQTHDDRHGNGELAAAATCYVAAASITANLGGKSWGHKPPFEGWVGFGWPWEAEWWKPGTMRQMLVKAAALIIAEIERLDRAAQEGSADGR